MVQDLVTRATSIGKSLPLSVVMGGWTLCESPRRPYTPEVPASHSRRTGEFLPKIEPGPEGKHWIVQLSEDDAMPWGSVTDERHVRPTSADALYTSPRPIRGSDPPRLGNRGS